MRLLHTVMGVIATVSGQFKLKQCCTLESLTFGASTRVDCNCCSVNREIGKKVQRVTLILMKGADGSVASAFPSTENKAKRERAVPASFLLLCHWPLLFSLSFGDVSFNVVPSKSRKSIQRSFKALLWGDRWGGQSLRGQLNRGS